MALSPVVVFEEYWIYGELAISSSAMRGWIRLALGRGLRLAEARDSLESLFAMLKFVALNTCRIHS